jgi:hypothetical protein
MRINQSMMPVISNFQPRIKVELEVMAGGDPEI